MKVRKEELRKEGSWEGLREKEGRSQEKGVGVEEERVCFGEGVRD